ncbi:MAG TPA: sugar transferase [Solirubrobacteraceae bacterium]|nr:sugar transferase [Solirubrobacteraceae bacterium]
MTDSRPRAGTGLGLTGIAVPMRRAIAALPVALAAIAAAAVFAAGSATQGALALAAYSYAGFAATRTARWRWLLKLSGALSYLVLPVVGTAGTLAVFLVTREPIAALRLAGAAGLSLAVAMIGWQVVAPRVRVHLGVIGSPGEARRLQEELAGSGNREYEVSAVITPDDWVLDPAALSGPYVCALSGLGRAIDLRRLEILVITQEFPAAQIHERLAREVITRPVQIMGLSEFHEHRFGAVPLAEIDYSWFSSLAGVHYRPIRAVVKRVMDIAIVLPVFLALGPLILVLATRIRRFDGGPALYGQDRVGYGGVPFRIYKLRSMRVAPPGEAGWTTSDDDRVTPIGRFLRRTHLDEYPQLWNILRGEMSLVGPRPEQVSYVEKLSGQIPFYGQRHLVQPGLTGWAQVRIGYAGSLRGTVFKLCNDLWYVKHQSLSLDIVILAETVRTLFADKQFVDDPVTSRTLAGERERAVLAEPDGLH